MHSLLFVVLENQLELLTRVLNIYSESLDLLTLPGIFDNVLVQFLANIEENTTHLAILVIFRGLPEIYILKRIFSFWSCSWTGAVVHLFTPRAFTLSQSNILHYVFFNALSPFRVVKSSNCLVKGEGIRTDTGYHNCPRISTQRIFE